MTPLATFKIWLIEPDTSYANLLTHQLSRNPDYALRRFPSGTAALEGLRTGQLRLPSAIIMAYDAAADALAHDLVQQLRAQLPTASLYIISDQPDVRAAISFVRDGATDFLVKDAATPEQLWQLLGQARKQATVVGRAQPKAAPDATSLLTSKLLGEHASMQRVRELIAKAARTAITVSITGETGTGKELVAQAIHEQSSRAKQPFVAVNMAAIPRELLESELFGHEKGAFTGAAARRIGHLEAADGGTLFLDEIGDLELSLQAKLLRVLQERSVTRLGGSKPVPFDVRLVVATHRDLQAEARAGRFREDLYYRLLGLPIELPPLRQRGQDCLLLAESFVRSFSRQNGLSVCGFDATARQRLLNYPFPGNVRELKAIAELAAVMAEGKQIRACDLPPLLTDTKGKGSSAAATITAFAAPTPADLPCASLREQTLAIMQHSLLATRGDVVAAATRLRIGRSTLYRLIQSGHLRLPQA
jgi:two-component system response regulator AtoC